MIDRVLPVKEVGEVCATLTFFRVLQEKPVLSAKFPGNCRLAAPDI